MIKRVRYTVMLILLLSSAIQALAQIPLPEKVCIGTVRHYWVVGMAGSTYTWKINGVVQSSITNEIDITWTSIGAFNLEVQEHQPTCDGDIQSGWVEVSDLIIPTFDPVASICLGSVIPALPLSSTNGITGTWSPGIDNMVTTEYTFTPDAGQCATTAKLTITVNPAPSATISGSTAVCLDAPPPAITFSGSGGTVPYTFTYRLNGGTDQTITTTSGNDVVIIVPTDVADSYVYELLSVADASGAICVPPQTGSATVTVNSSIIPSFEVVSSYCADATIPALPLVSANGITGIWSPAINNTETTEYTFTPDAGQCAIPVRLTILISILPIPEVSVIQPTCNDTSGRAVVTFPEEGSGYEYSVDNGAFQASASFTNLLSGDHSFVVRHTSSSCISEPVSQTINSIPTVPLIVAKAEDPKCFGENGSIDFDFIGVPDGSYTISYDGGQFLNVPVRNGQATVAAKAGAYNHLSIKVLDCHSAQGVNVVLNQPTQIEISELITEIDYMSGQKGTINLTVSGGTEPYSYNWNNGETTEDIDNLQEGSYKVTVVDSNGCQSEKIAFIPAPNMPPVAVNDEFTAGCFAATGSLIANDSDPDGDLFFIDQLPVSSPKYGALTINSNGTFEYLAEIGYTGLDEFEYAIYDVNHYMGDTVAVTITVLPDFDCDGLTDHIDPDADADGILNVDEVTGGQDWETTDSDGDGNPNWLDIDADNDGIVDNFEAQKGSDYIPPISIDADADGIDDAYDTNYGGTVLVPIDTDEDGTPDFLDADSDNDGVPDYIEGHDLNANGRPDYVLNGGDEDADGLDDAYDTANRYTSQRINMTATNAAMQDFDGDGEPDWRDINDDNDEYLTRFEDLNMDGDFSNDDTDFDGHPEYLDYGRDCDLFVPEAFSPNNDNIHDYFQIYCIDHFPDAKLYIFDQLGNKLFEKEHYGNLDFWGTPERAWWDARSTNRVSSVNGGKVVSGTYYYVLVLGNGEVKKSFVFVSY